MVMTKLETFIDASSDEIMTKNIPAAVDTVDRDEIQCAVFDPIGDLVR